MALTTVPAHSQVREPLTGVSIKSIRHSYTITAQPLRDSAATSPPKLLVIDNGLVTLDGVRVLRPRFGDYILNWGDAGGSHARLQISKDRLWFEGLIGRAAAGGTSEVYVVTGVAQSVSTSLPNGQLLEAQYQPDPDSGRIGLNLRLGGTALPGTAERDLDETGMIQVRHPALPGPVALNATVSPTPSFAASAADAPGDPPSGVQPRGSVTLDLPHLITQDTEGIGDETQTLLMSNMAWALEPKWSSAFFNSVPNLSQYTSRMNVIDQDCEWYNSSFAPAYFGYGLSQMTREKAKYTLSPQYVSRLQYYICEDIGEDFTYTKQTKALTVMAALQATASNTPNLADYANDSSNPAGYWAQQLFNNYLNTPAHYGTLTGGVPDQDGNYVQQSLQNAMQTINNYATILTVLDSTGNLAQQYYEYAYAATFAAFTPNAELPDNVGAYEEWLGDWIQALIAAYMASPTQPADPAAAAAWSAGQEFASALTQLAQTADQMATSIAQLMVAKNTGLFSTTAADAATAWATANPKVAGLSKYFLVITVSALFVQSLLGTANMSDLSAVDLTAAINNLVGITAGMLAVIPDIVNAAKWTATMTKAIVTCMFNPNGIANVVGLLRNGGNPANVMGWMRNALGNGNNVNPEGSMFAQVFKAAPKLLAYLGAVVAVVAAGIAVWNLVVDIQAGASVPTIVFDSLNTALSFVAAGAAIAAIACASVIPAVIGAIAALGGLVVWFVASFFQDDPPPSPPDQYLQTVAAPFAAGLPDPPTGWTPPNVTQSTSPTAIARRLASLSTLRIAPAASGATA